MVDTPQDTHNNYGEIAKKYLSLLLAAKRQDAINMVIEFVEDGLPLRAVYLDIIQPVLYEVGRLWQVNKIDIAEEHYCSASTQLLMSQLFPYTLHRTPSKYKMIGCCLGSELHEIGMRVVCDFFELEGWDTYFTGAITPSDSLVEQIKKQSPDLVCLSSTMHYGVHEAREIINDIKSINDIQNTKIMVGGLSFIMNPHLYKLVGADATAADAQEAINEAYKLV